VRKALKRLKAGNVVLERDFSPPTPQMTKAFVKISSNFLGMTWLTDGKVYIKDDFFKGSPRLQRDDLNHEMGRLMGFIGEDLSGDFYSDVYEWDKVLEWGASKYDELVQEKGVKGEK
jgi:hypothetical protein